MEVSKNIQQAVTLNLRFHVISENEIHSFMKLKEALEDKEGCEREQKRLGVDAEVECLSQEEAIEKYL